MLNNLIRFVENTKAKASEVNYNFDQVKAKIQELDDWKTNTDDKLSKYSSFQLFDLIVTDRVLTGEEAKGKLLQGSLVTNLYPDAVAKIKDEWDNGAEQTYTYGEDISFPYRLAANRHMIVDALYKDDVDALFAATGVAWFYIWDKDNEQFYLPRSLWFDQYTNDPEKVNKFNEAGLPDHYHKVGAQRLAYNSGANTNAVYNEDGTLLTTNYASVSNPIYGKSNTVQPPSSNKLLYYVVGNTYVNQEDIDIAQVESDLNNFNANKLNITLDNATQDFWNNITPDYENGIVCETSLGTEKTYTIPSNGEIVVSLSAYNRQAPSYVKINEIEVMYTQGNHNPDFNSLICTFRVKKNDIIKYFSAYFSLDFNSQNIVFYPYIGV